MDNFANMVNNIIMLTKTTFKKSIKVKRIRKMFLNAFLSVLVAITKIANFC